MNEPLTFEQIKAAAPLTFEQIQAQQEIKDWAPPSAEEEAIRSDWAVPATVAAGVTGALLGGPLVGGAAFIAAGAAEIASAGAGKAAGLVHPSLETPVHLISGVALGFTAEQWFIQGTVKAANQVAKIPKFWSKEFAVARKKGVIPQEFIDDNTDIIRNMDMGDSKAVESMRKILKQDIFSDRMIAVGKRLEKLTAEKVVEPTTKLLKRLKKKVVLRDEDYQLLSSAAQEEAVMEYNKVFNKIRTEAVQVLSKVKQNNHPVTKVIEIIKENGGVSSKYEFDSPELAKSFFEKHKNLKASGGVTANLEDIARKFDYDSVGTMISRVQATPNEIGFKRLAASELAPEFRRIYADEISLRIADRRAAYLFKLHNIEGLAAQGFKSHIVEASRRTSNRLPAKQVIQEVKSLKKSVSKLLGVLQSTRIKTNKTQLVRLRKIYTEQLIDYKAAVEVKKKLGLINTHLKHVTGVHGEYREQVQNLLAPLFDKPKKKLEETLFQFLKRKNEDDLSIGAGVVLQKYDVLLKSHSFMARNFLDLTYSQAKNLDDFVEAMSFISRNERYITVKSGEQLLAAYTKEILSTAETTISKLKLFRPRTIGSQLEELAKGKPGKLTAFRRSTADLQNGILASLKRIEAICYQLDGFKSFGRAWHSVFNKTIMAEAAKTQLEHRIFGRYKNILNTPVMNNMKYWSATSGTLAGHPLSKEVAFCMALNTKNMDNVTAMLEGLQVTEKELTTFLDSALTKNDWKLIDDLLDFFEKDIFPIVAKTYKQKTGMTFQAAKGGRYFPIRADLRHFQPKVSVNDIFIDPSSKFSQRQVRHTFDELRKGGVKAVRLDFNSMTQHLADVVHYSTHWGPLNEIQRLVNTKDFKTAVETTMGRETYAQFKPWLSNLARPSITRIDSWVSKARRNVTFASLALVPKIAVKQSLSFLTAMPKVGYANSMKALYRFSKNPMSISKAIKDASPEMADRARTWNRDFIDFMSEISATDNKGQLLKIGYAMIHKVDEVTASTVWLGAYEKGLVKYAGDGTPAVNYANKVVRSTQPASAPKDIPLIMRNGELLRGVSMFYSYWSLFHGQVAELISKGLSKHLTPIQVTGTLAWLFTAPVIAQHLAKAAWNAATGREQEKNLLGEIMSETALGPVAGLPVMRDLANCVVKDYDYQVSPLVHIPKSVISTSEAVGKFFDEDAEYNMYDAESVANLVSSFTLVPSKAMITLVNGALRYYEGETQDFTELFDKPDYKKGD